jgi:hypothetical protein
VASILGVFSLLWIQTRQLQVIQKFGRSLIRKSIAESNPTAASTIELDKYIAEPTLLRTSDPLHWWNDRKTLYPRLYTVVKKRLCVVATSVKEYFQKQNRF